MNNDLVTMIHCLTYLAVHEGQRFSSRQLAHNACSNPVIVRRLMSLANQADLITTENGPNGGYMIKVAPDQIDLGSLYILVGEDARQRKKFKESVDEVCMVANNIGSVMEKLQEEAIQAQINFYTSKSLEDVINDIKAEAAK